MLALDQGTADLLLTTELGAPLAGTGSWLTASKLSSCCCSIKWRAGPDSILRHAHVERHMVVPSSPNVCHIAVNVVVNAPSPVARTVSRPGAVSVEQVRSSTMTDGFWEAW